MVCSSISTGLFIIAQPFLLPSPYPQELLELEDDDGDDCELLLELSDEEDEEEGKLCELLLELLELDGELCELLLELETLIPAEAPHVALYILALWGV